MKLVTVFCTPMTTGEGELVLQTPGENRLVEDCKVKPTALVGHVKTWCAPETVIVSCAGEESGLVGSVEASHSCQLSTPSPSGSALSVAGLMSRLNCCKIGRAHV